MSLQPQEGIRKPLPTYLGYQAKQTSGLARNQQDPWEKKEPPRLISHPESLIQKSSSMPIPRSPTSLSQKREGIIGYPQLGSIWKRWLLQLHPAEKKEQADLSATPKPSNAHGLEVWSFGSFLCIPVPGFELSSQNKVLGLEASVLSVED